MIVSIFFLRFLHIFVFIKIKTVACLLNEIGGSGILGGNDEVIKNDMQWNSLRANLLTIRFFASYKPLSKGCNYMFLCKETPENKEGLHRSRNKDKRMVIDRPPPFDNHQMRQKKPLNGTPNKSETGQQK